MERPPRQRRHETPVVPLHAHRSSPAMRTVGGLALAEPIAAPAPETAPATAPRQPSTPGGVRGARARRATKERLAHDGWTFVVVPPGLNARPRTLHVSVRRFRVVAMALATIAGTAVVCGMLLAVMLSVAPTVQDESAGVALGLFGSEPAAPQTFVPAPEELDLISMLAIGPAAATVATPEVATSAPSEKAAAARPVGPRTSAAKRSAASERRRVIAPPSVSGARESRSRVVAMAEGMPVIGRITSQFSNSRRHPVLGVVRPHRGVDIAASSGTPITAPAGGRVVFSGRKFGFGNVVEIDHGHGIITRYAHCRTLKVKRGAQVEAGETIATVGRTGLASGPHLHFEVLLDGRSVDPIKNRVEKLISDRSPARPAPATSANLFVPGLTPTPITAPVATTSDSTSGGAAREEAGTESARNER